MVSIIAINHDYFIWNQLNDSKQYYWTRIVQSAKSKIVLTLAMKYKWLNPIIFFYIELNSF